MSQFGTRCRFDRFNILGSSYKVLEGAVCACGTIVVGTIWALFLRRLSQ